MQCPSSAQHVMSLTEDEAQGESQAQAGAEAILNGPGSEQRSASLPNSFLDDAPGSQADASVYSSEDQGSYRENRFQGADSTWRAYTQDERALAASLDQERANDLSVHLYNAHALKARLRTAQAERATKSWQSKQRWLSAEDDGKVPWHPPRKWTAWPLPAARVPRKQEVFGAPPPVIEDVHGTFRKEEDWVLSADLHEELQALMLRKAKERFCKHTWTEPSDEPIVRPQRDGQDDDVSSGSDSVGSTVLETAPSKRAQGKSRAARVSDTPDEHYPPPEFTADDERSGTVLAPSIRHILSQFDDLLLGLHKSRLGHRQQQTRSRSRSRTSVSQAPSTSMEPSVPAMRTKGAVKSERLQPTVLAAVSAEDHRGRKSSTGTSRQGKPARRHHPGARDWSEVLGMASLVGWDPSVVQRATQRCADLFGESMDFRTLAETSVAQPAVREMSSMPGATPTQDQPADESEEVDERPQPSQTEVQSHYFCPYITCPRHTRAYNQPNRWREHLRKAHKLSLKEVYDLEASLGLRAEVMHGGSPTAVPRQTSADSNSPEVTDADGMTGGVHDDGFMQVIDLDLGRGRDLHVRRKRDYSSREGSKRRKLDTGRV